MIISKKKHEAIVADLSKKIKLFEQYEAVRKDNQKNTDSLMEILQKLTDKVTGLEGVCGTYGSFDVMAALDDTVPRYVEDYFGGKVIKQEATPVTILDENGKATYGFTKQAPDKGKTYKLVQK